MKRKVDFILELLKDIYPEGLKSKDYDLWEKTLFADRCNLFGMMNLMAYLCNPAATLACGGWGFHTIEGRDIHTLQVVKEAIESIIKED